MSGTRGMGVLLENTILGLACSFSARGSGLHGAWVNSASSRTWSMPSTPVSLA